MKKRSFGIIVLFAPCLAAQTRFASGGTGVIGAPIGVVRPAGPAGVVGNPGAPGPAVFSTTTAPRTNAASTDAITSTDCPADGSLGFVSETFAGNVAISLPATNGFTNGCNLTVKNLSGFGFQATLTPASGTLIDGMTSLSFDYPGDLTLTVDGATWKAAGGNGVRCATNLATQYGIPFVQYAGCVNQVAPPTTVGLNALVENVSIGGTPVAPTFVPVAGATGVSGPFSIPGLFSPSGGISAAPAQAACATGPGSVYCGSLSVVFGSPTLTGGGAAHQYLQNLSETSYGPGQSQNSRWRIYSVLSLSNTAYDRGINQALSVSHYCNRTGDCAGAYINAYGDFGEITANDEGYESLALDGGENVGYFHGTLTSMDASGTLPVVAFSGGAANNNWLTDGTYFEDVTPANVVASGNLNGAGGVVQGTTQGIRYLTVTTLPTATRTSAWCQSTRIFRGRTNSPTKRPLQQSIVCRTW